MENAVELLRREKRVKLAYLFGSAARGEMGKLSDIDIGVYLDESLSDDQRFKLQLELMSRLAAALKTDNVDLIVMNNAPLLLNYNIIKHGKPIKFKGQAKVRFEAGILSRYLDRKYSIDRHTSIGIKRIAERGFS
jgi:predicted nucleotidyltransferase